MKEFTWGSEFQTHFTLRKGEVRKLESSEPQDAEVWTT